MKTSIRILAFVMLSLTGLNANAIGFGLYTTASNSGTAEWDYPNTVNDFETDVDQKEIGIVMDTAVASDNIFNYRLQLASVKTSYERQGFNDIEMEGKIMTHTFGFAVVRNQTMRLWIGPQISLRDLDSKDNNLPLEIDGGGLQAAAGINLYISPSLSLTGELGYSISNNYHVDSDTAFGHLDIEEDRSFFNVGIIYRFGDNY